MVFCGLGGSATCDFTAVASAFLLKYLVCCSAWPSATSLLARLRAVLDYATLPQLAVLWSRSSFAAWDSLLVRKQRQAPHQAEVSAPWPTAQLRALANSAALAAYPPIVRRSIALKINFRDFGFEVGLEHLIFRVFLQCRSNCGLLLFWRRSRFGYVSAAVSSAAAL